MIPKTNCITREKKQGCPRVKYFSTHHMCTAQTIKWITPAAKLDFSDAETYKICPHMNVHSKYMNLKPRFEFGKRKGLAARKKQDRGAVGWIRHSRHRWRARQ